VSNVAHVNGGTFSATLSAKICTSALDDIFNNTYNATGTPGCPSADPNPFSLVNPRFRECRYFRTDNGQIWQILGGFLYEYSSEAAWNGASLIPLSSTEIIPLS
jgi:hypothetical protein